MLAGIVMANERPEYGYANPQVAANEVSLGSNCVMYEGLHGLIASPLS